MRWPPRGFLGAGLLVGFAGVLFAALFLLRGVPAGPAPARPVAPTEVGDAATRLIDAWMSGDRQGALRVATPGAVDELFASPPAQPAPTLDECYQTGEAVWDCHFSFRSGVVVVRVSPGARGPQAWDATVFAH